MKNNILLTQSFGREYEYKRAILAIWSYFAHVSPSLNTKVVLFTDKPEYFKKYLEGLPIEYSLLNDQKIKELKGNINFIHRMKIGIIKETLEKYNNGESLFYIDSDTFFIKNPQTVIDSISSNTFFMHLHEYEFSSIDINIRSINDPMRKLIEYIKNNTFKIEHNSKFKIRLNHSSWNAGVMIFDNSHKQYLNDVYSITEQLYSTTLCHASEQFAFSIIFQEKFDIQSCDNIVFHYWYRTRKIIIDLFLDKLLNDNWANLSLDTKKKEILKLTQTLPNYIETHPMIYEDHAIQAFNIDDFKNGYSYAIKSLLKRPNNIKLIKDILYHTKRKLK